MTIGPEPITIDVDEAFTTYDGANKYYAAKTLNWESDTEIYLDKNGDPELDEFGNEIYRFEDIPIWTEPDFPITMTTEEIDGEFYEVLTYATTCEKPAEWAGLEGGKVTVSYIYYTYTPRDGSRTQPARIDYMTVDFHRDIVLKRKIE